MDFDRLMPTNRSSSSLQRRSLSDMSSLSRLSLGDRASSRVSLSSYPHFHRPTSSNGTTLNNSTTTIDTYSDSIYGPAPSIRSTDTSLTFANLPGLTDPSSSPADPITAAITTGSHHLSTKKFNLAFDQFKLALKLLKSIPPTSNPQSTHLSTIAAHLGMHDALIQAASAKKRSPDKARSHLESAETSMLRALGLAKTVSDNPLPMLQVHLAMLVVSIMKAELQVAGEAAGQRSQGNTILPEHADSLMDKILELQGKLGEEMSSVRGRGAEGLEGWLVLERKVEAWRRRLAVRHCGLPELASG